MKTVMAVDPGTDKCGVAVLSGTGEILVRKVVAADALLANILELNDEHQPAAVVVGDGTGSRRFIQNLRKKGGSALEEKLVQVDERHTSEQARRRYWRESGRHGWRRLVPESFQTPPEPYDDWVAVILAERFLEQQG